MSSNGSEGNTGLECTECGRHFSAKRSLRRHTLKKHCLDKPIFRRSLAMIDQSLGGGTKINLTDTNLKVTLATYTISKKPHYTQSMTQILSHLVYVTQNDCAWLGGWPDFIKWSLTNSTIINRHFVSMRTMIIPYY